MGKDIGKGTFGKVKAAQNMDTMQLVAMKKLSKPSLKRKRQYGHDSHGKMTVSTALDQVRTEIKIMSGLDDPGVVGLRAVLEDDSEPSMYLVLDFASQGALMSWDMKKGFFDSNIFPKTAAGGVPEDGARHVYVSVLRGLKYLHAQRVIHRDIKPDNILVTARGTVQIADFGVAHQLGANESPIRNDSQGTYHFFSPEMCAGEPYDAYRADHWALAVTCFAMAFGSVPWMSDENNPSELFDKIKTGTLTFPNTKISAEWRAFLSAVLEPDPKKRLTLQQIEQHPWVLAQKLWIPALA
jgi:[calcium/calmodulin-dependent protein kinase] kinase